MLASAFFGELRRFFLHNSAVLRSVSSATDGRSQTGTNMLETYFSASKMLGHLRSGPSGPYLDGFAAALERQGYSAGTAVRYLRAAAHLGHVVARQGAMPTRLIWRCSASTCALVDVRAPREGAATTTPFSAPGSFASTLSKSAFAGRAPHAAPSRASWPTSKCGCASTAGRPTPPSNSTLVTPPT